MDVDVVLNELREKHFFALDRAAPFPSGILRELVHRLKARSLKYSFLKSREKGAGFSLSDIHGLDDFPFHTDGAHLAIPPDYIFLFAPMTRETSTLIANPSDVINLNSDIARDAAFNVKRRGKLFNVRFVEISRGAKRVRYNPDSMSPKNAAAFEVQRRMKQLERCAMAFSWEQWRLLILDNGAVMHGRSAIGSARSYIRRFEVKL